MLSFGKVHLHGAGGSADDGNNFTGGAAAAEIEDDYAQTHGPRVAGAGAIGVDVQGLGRVGGRQRAKGCGGAGSRRLALRFRRGR